MYIPMARPPSKEWRANTGSREVICITIYLICYAVSRREKVGYPIIWSLSVIMAWNQGHGWSHHGSAIKNNVSSVTTQSMGAGVSLSI